ncbi:MAG: 50S ribosomal protein L31e [Candidatus Bathyarchaeia archaeon]|jgi:large subunit ribosomal protein L31e
MEKPVDVAEVEEELDEELDEELEVEEDSESELPEDEEELEDEEEEDEELVETKERSKKKETKETEEEIVEERFYTIPLSKAWIYPRKKRAPKSARIVKSFVTKHMKIKTIPDEDEEEAERLVISNEVNEKLWSRGIEKPPRKIRVRVTKDKEGVVTVLLAEGE